jgi:hypothetical protein
MEWKLMKNFDLPVETMVMTSTYVTRDGMPILQVSHEYDEVDGDDWQFHCGNDDYSMEKLQLVRLSTILKFDPDLLVIADLPVGYVAKRTAVGIPWVYVQN